MKELKNSGWVEKTYPIAEAAILLYILECTLGSSGRWLSVGPFSIRMILFALCFVASLPAVFVQLKQLVRNAQVWVTVAFGVWLVICFALGLRNGNNTGFAVADLTSFMALALLPGFLAVIRTHRAVERCMKTVFCGSLILSIITVGIHYALAFCTDKQILWINDLLNIPHLGGLALLNTGLQRIFMRSQIFIQAGLLYGVWMIGFGSKTKQRLLVVALSIMLFALVLSYTRGFWAGFAASAVLLLLMEIKKSKKLLKFVGVVALGFMILSLVSVIIYRSPAVYVEVLQRFDPELLPEIKILRPGPEIPDGEETFTDIANKEATLVRKRTLEGLRRMIAQKPIVGSGLGANLDDVRSDGKAEYMYMDITMKTGFVGIILMFVTFFGFCVKPLVTHFTTKAFQKEVLWSSKRMRNHVLLAALVGVAVTSIFNPFLANPMGIAAMMITAAAYAVTGKEEE